MRERGIYIEFNWQDCSPRKLWEVINEINLDSLVWYNAVEQAETYSATDREEHFTDERYDGVQLARDFADVDSILFLKLQGYDAGSTVETVKPGNIVTFDEFEASSCKAVVLIVDCYELTIYIKGDEEQLERIRKKAIDSGCRECRILTDENDGRTGMNIR